MLKDDDVFWKGKAIKTMEGREMQLVVRAVPEVERYYEGNINILNYGLLS